MPINFHDEKSRHSYATRSADETWTYAMRQLLDPKGLRVTDIGCGGGIYSRAWAHLGIERVIGVDSFKVMVETARERLSDMQNVSFVVGDAVATGLNDAQ